MAEITEKPQKEQPDSVTSNISWTASEYISHDKTAGWYAMLGLATAVISGIVYLISHDIISVAVVAVAGLLLGIFGARSPRQLEYSIDTTSISIGTKTYLFDHFRSFSVMPEGAFNSIVFMPLKRFSPPLSIYYDPKDENRILDVLKSRLPFEERRRDAIESLMHRIRF